jgi:hypothetical protein
MARMGKARDLPEFQFVGPLEMSRNHKSTEITPIFFSLLSAPVLSVLIAP